MPAKLLRERDLLDRIGFGKTKARQLWEEGKLPKPVKIGKANRWLSDEVDAWLEEQREKARKKSE